MPRPSKGLPDLTPDQALFVLSKLLEDGRTNRSEIARYMSRVEEEIRDLESRLARLRGSASAEPLAPSGQIERPRAGRPARPRKRSVAGGAKRARKAARRAKSQPAAEKAPVTRKQRLARREQGAYLSLMRKVPADKKDQYKKIVKDESRAAAIARLRADLAQ